MNGLKRMQEYLVQESIDAVIINSMVNLHYFAGFTGTTGLACILKNKAFFISDFRYTAQAKKQCEDFEIIEHKGSAWDIIDELVKEGILSGNQWAIEENHMYVKEYLYVKERFPKIEWSPRSFELLRAEKREDELIYLRKAAQIADEAFAALLPQIQSGMSENDLRILLECEMLRRGSEGPSFDTIVASGYRSSMPHGVASDKIIEKGDFITFDFGAIYKGYHSDMTRTIVLGKASPEQYEVYHDVLTAQELGVASVKIGASCKEIDRIVRTKLDEKGYGPYFGHGLGHGVGLDIHELPVLNQRSNDILAEHMIVTIEPGVYFPNKWGLRIEDSLVVKKDGVEILTKTPKKLLEI